MSVVTKITAKYRLLCPGRFVEGSRPRWGTYSFLCNSLTAHTVYRRFRQVLTEALRLAGNHLSPQDFRRVHREFEKGWEDEQE